VFDWWSRRGLFLLASLVALAASACNRQSPTVAPATPKPSPTSGISPAPGVLALSSPDFQEGDDIPDTFSCDGENRSPRLAWTGIPESTVEVGLHMTDPDAPEGVFTHWIVFGLDPSSSGVESASLPAGAKQGRNSFARTGYGGPCPPRTTRHTYVFTLFALSKKLDLPDGVPTDRFEEALVGAELQRAVLSGTFAR
jgi:Raf kinase inhibitor-like YbhB/YbcL family protein